MAQAEDMPQLPSLGLDRATIYTYDEVSTTPTNGSPKTPSTRAYQLQDSHDNVDDTHSSRISTVRRLSRKLKAKFHHSTLSESSPPSNDQRRFDKTILAPTLAPNPPSAINDDRFGDKPPEKPKLPPLKDFISSPLETAKTVAQTQGGNDFAENMAKTDISHGASVNLVRSYDKVVDAKTEEERESALEDFDSLKKARQDAFVRWTLDRHVNKVGRVVPLRVPWKDREEFMKEDERGRNRTQWREYGNHLLLFHLHQHAGRYIGASSDLSDPTERALAASFERVLLTSMPLQNLVMKLRRIADWDDPWESGMYLGLYFTLLIYSYITRAVLLLVLFMVLKRRYFPRTIEDMRSDLKQAEDMERTAQDITQLIDAHGPHGWIDPLMSQAGPNMLCNLEDLANIMEIIRNFFEWRDPTRTAVTLSILLFTWLMITLTPVHILVHETFFALGVMFFGLTPIAKRFPQYRLLASPTIWLFWKIPTHAEWAIARVQAEGTQRLSEMHEREESQPKPNHGSEMPYIPTASSSSPGKQTQDSHGTANPETEPTSPSKPGSNTSSSTNAKSPKEQQQEEEENESRPLHKPALRIGRYHCTSDKAQGNLCVSTDRVSFEIHLLGTEKWSMRYDDMKSIEKADKKRTIRSGGDLRFVDEKGNEYMAEALKARDEVFSQIIGYSDVKWQKTG